MSYGPYRCITLGIVASLSHRFLIEIAGDNHILELLGAVIGDLLGYFRTEVTRAKEGYQKSSLDFDQVSLIPE